MHLMIPRRRSGELILAAFLDQPNRSLGLIRLPSRAKLARRPRGSWPFDDGDDSA